MPTLEEVYPIFSIVGTSVIIVLLCVEIWYNHQAHLHRQAKQKNHKYKRVPGNI